MKIAVVGASAIAFALLWDVSPAWAACLKPDAKVCAEFFKSDAVFVGRVVAQRTVPASANAYDGWVYRVQVQRVFRGSLGKTVEVFTENSSGRFPLEVGREYVLFASRWEGRLAIDNCGNSSVLSGAEHTLREIKRAGTAANGAIEGQIVSKSSWDGVEGIRVVASDGIKTYAAETDHDGRFRMNVPPGRYRVHVASPRVEPYDLSRDNPAGFTVARGGCAQLQFLADPP